MFITLFSSQFASASYLPKGCQEGDLLKLGGGQERYEKALNLKGSGTVEPHVHPSKDEHGISRRDLEKEIIYFNPLNNKCSYQLIKNTPFGKWADKELAWRELQNLSPKDLSYMPVEGKGVSYSPKEWRTFTLSMQANLYDRRAVNGYAVIVDEATECQKNLSKQDIDKIKEFSKAFKFFYQEKLIQHLGP